jgi:hypothetical protein
MAPFSEVLHENSFKLAVWCSTVLNGEVSEGLVLSLAPASSSSNALIGLKQRARNLNSA